jgi:hypothetical protein
VNGSILSTDFRRQFDIRQLKPNDIAPARLRFGFGSWNNNNASPYADILHLNAWDDASGGETNALMVRKGGFGIRQYRGTFNGSTNYSNFRDVVMNGSSDNVGIGTTAPRQRLDVEGGNAIVSGNIGIGTTTPSFKLHVYTNATGNIALFEGSNHNIALRTGSVFTAIGTATNGDLDLEANNTAHATVTAGGRFGIGTFTPGFQLELSTDSAAKPSTNTWTVSSDARIKEDIEYANIERCYDIIKTLPLRRFKWKEGLKQPDRRGGQTCFNPGDDHSMLGFIAQEVQPIFPKAVKSMGEQYGIPDFLTLQSDQLYKSLYGAVQYLANKVERLEHEIDLYRQEHAQG